ncbi:DUF2061 domain-containing protein [Winogradskyella psychrotolerans]|uniref:DUF2061 domain-containing protein n=1 Tax=Winogradskyella psychrotolerans TaxID=1344585 RepID=UPI001C0717BD|nr:DUF2061 domain-containing protein [Winogradskyella psychrotolerans]MBU2927590.1 DUF2061 domain-containing protein [Winogradskyella psychrotolerans]
MKFSKRHFAKTITWRIIGTLDTFLLSWFISGNVKLGSQIAFMELITKMVLYYLHERAWFKSKIESSNKRHILKTFSWRAVGTIDTFVLGWIVTGNPLTGLKIGGAEVLTKMVLYFGHEKLWYRIDFGLDKRNRRKRLNQLKKSKEL